MLHPLIDPSGETISILALAVLATTGLHPSEVISPVLYVLMLDQTLFLCPIVKRIHTIIICIIHEVHKHITTIITANMRV